MSDERGRILLRVARAAITSRFGRGPRNDETEPWLEEPGACFVTLTINNVLRGCVGSLAPYRSLRDDVWQNAQSAAFHDPRFLPLSDQELAKVRVEVSLLSPIVPLQFCDESDAVAQIRPGMDGVVLEYGRNRGTFLPQVWEQLPTPREFFRHLKIKAGLPSDFWADGVLVSRYSVEKFSEAESAGDRE